MRQQSSRALQRKSYEVGSPENCTLVKAFEYHSIYFHALSYLLTDIYILQKNVKGLFLSTFYLFQIYFLSYLWKNNLWKNTHMYSRLWRIYIEKVYQLHLVFYSLCSGRFLRYRRVIVVCRMVQCRTKSLRSRTGPVWLAWRSSLIMRVTSC